MELAIEVLEVVSGGSDVLNSLWEVVNELLADVGSIVLSKDEVAGCGVNPGPCLVVWADEEVEGVSCAEEWISDDSNEG